MKPIFFFLGFSMRVVGVIGQASYRPGSSGTTSGGSNNSGGSAGFGSGGSGGGSGGGRPGTGGDFGSTGGSGSSGGSGGFGGSNDAGFAGGNNGGSLEEAIPGVPGDDYPILAEVPETSFLCDGQVDGGYYADPEAECQAFHICANNGNGGLTKFSFLCPNGTLFQQQYFVCDWWFNVDCSTAQDFWSLNEEIAAEREANSPAGAGGDQYAGGQGGGRGGAGGAGGRRGGSQGSASSPRGSYSSPSGGQGAASSPRGSYAAPSGGQGGFGADAAYGAPGGFGGALGGYARNSREVDLEQILQDLNLVEEDTVMNKY